MTSHPMFHESPTVGHHAKLCFSCIIRNGFAKNKVQPTFPLEAFRLFGDLLSLTLHQKHGKVGADVHVTCQDILDGMYANSQELMGGLGPMVFDVLGIRSTKDLDVLMEESMKADIFRYKDDGDRFSNYKVDLLELLRKPEVKGSP